MTFEDIVGTVKIASENIVELSEEEINHFSGIVFEAVLKPSFSSARGGAGLKMKEAVIRDENVYFREIIQSLEEKKNWPIFIEEAAYLEICWADFLREVRDHLRMSQK
jgi:hypothetical protein